LSHNGEGFAAGGRLSKLWQTPTQGCPVLSSLWNGVGWESANRWGRRRAHTQKSSMRPLFLAIFALLVLSIAGVVVYWTFFRPTPEPVALIQDTTTPQTQPKTNGTPDTRTPTTNEASPTEMLLETQTPTPLSPLTDTVVPSPTDAPEPILPAGQSEDSQTATAEFLTTQTAEEPDISPTPTNIAEVGLIAFNSNRAGNNDIYVMNADGSQVTRITNSPYDERVPSWSPDGRQIAYQSNEAGNYELTVYDLQSRRVRRLTNNNCDDYNPVWSPDGAWLAFYSDCDGNREIYIIRSDGSGRRQLTHTNSVYNWFPNWSPDGRQITFTSNRSGKYEIYIMNVDGSGARALGRGCISAFSPDGEYLAFTQYCTDTGQIYLSRTDGSDLQIFLEEENSTNPSWSPDGQRLLFQSERTGNEEIYVINIDGSELTQLTFDPGRDSAPVWQPVPYSFP
jgi:Tol biopolymer transport system component